MKYSAYYWFDTRGDQKGRSVCETFNAVSMDDATRRVEERLRQALFSFNSDSHGRIIVVTSHVQYVEIESGHAECEDDEENLTHTPDIF